MDKRVLIGCVAALATMLGIELVGRLAGGTLDFPIRTAVGVVAVGNLLSTFVAMTLGGWIARRHFRRVAVALTAIAWIATIAVLVFVSPADGAGALFSLPQIIKFNALAIALGLLVSWLGAMTGERLAALQQRGPITA